MIKAKIEFHGQTFDVPVINPGGWFGKTWLIEIGGGFDPLFFIIEADSVQDAIDEFADSDEHGHHIAVADEDLGNYPEDSRSYAGNSSKVVDLDWLGVHGFERHGFPCRYYGDDLPADGIEPKDLREYTDE